ncbi:MAG: phospho-sugar mutase, partial [Bacteroidaceae bacterium]|nr:phospho-sugar mutase [Bacteroidaceae bacterium]
TRNELIAIKDDTKEIEDRFYRDLEFGTAGLRGVLGAGTNRMNVYTVAKASEGLAIYILSEGEEAIKRGVVISYDSRHFSPEFAQITAQVLAANGIPSRLSDELRPVPVLSFSVRYFKAFAGVMITASHNPSKYNGYKVYGEDGGQVPPEAADAVLSNIEAITDIRSVKLMDFEEAKAKGLVTSFGPEIDEAFTNMLTKLVVDQQAIDKQADMSIVYTPLHGSGNKPVRRILERVGFKNIHIVAEQEAPDGNFPTVVSPNPEYPEALTMALALARKLNADVVMASDPDADRLGVACRNDKGELTLLNGNQTAMIFLYYIITQYTKLGKMTGKEYIVKTIVTTEVISRIAEKNNLEMFDCYTGFKWIAKVIADENAKGKHYIGGGEESFGFLAEDFVRDKDAVSACSLMAEIAAWAKENGKTLWDLLLDAYQEYGFSQEGAVSVVKPGKSGADEIKAMMEQFRANPPKTLAGEKVVLVKDFKLLKQTDAQGKVTDLVMPEPSNVLQYFTAAGDKISVRPSGTEPKIKFYMEAKLPMASKNDYLKVQAQAMKKIDAFKKDLGI